MARTPLRRWRRSFASLEQLRRIITTDTPVVAASREGTVAGWLGVVDTPSLRLAAGALEGGVLSSGLTVEGCVTVTVVLEAQGGNIDDVPLARGRALLFPPGMLYRGWSAPGYRWLTAMLPGRVALRLSRAQGWRLPDMQEAPVLTAVLSEAELSWVEDQARRVGLTAPGAPTPPGGALEAEDVAGWGRILARLGRDGWVRGAAPRERRAWSAVRRATRWIEAHLDAPIRIGELCRVAGVPERTLVHMFRRHFGLPPRRTITLLRLQHAHRLLGEGPGEAREAIGAIARAVGLPHEGRFAAAYRALYGEPPRETRARARTASRPT